MKMAKKPTPAEEKLNNFRSVGLFESFKFKFVFSLLIF